MINSKGTLLADGIKRTSASDLYDGIFSVTMKDGRAGFMNLDGKLVFEIPQEYKDDGNRPSYSFWDGVMVITNGLPQGKHKCAVIDKNGNILGETEYFLSNFSDGLASFAYTVTKNDEKGHPATTEVFGYMDKHCNIVIPAVFEQNYVYSRPKFSNGYAEVNYRGRDLLLGNNGILYSKETNQPVFDLNKLKSQELFPRKSLNLHYKGAKYHRNGLIAVPASAGIAAPPFRNRPPAGGCNPAQGASCACMRLGGGQENPER